MWDFFQIIFQSGHLKNTAEMKIVFILGAVFLVSKNAQIITPKLISGHLLKRWVKAEKYCKIRWELPAGICWVNSYFCLSHTSADSKPDPTK